MAEDEQTLESNEARLGDDPAVSFAHDSQELLQDMWQYSTVADSFGSAMGPVLACRFRTASRGSRECMRDFLARIPAECNGPRPRKSRLQSCQASVHSRTAMPATTAPVAWDESLAGGVVTALRPYKEAIVRGLAEQARVARQRRHAFHEAPVVATTPQTAKLFVGTEPSTACNSEDSCFSYCSRGTSLGEDDEEGTRARPPQRQDKATQVCVRNLWPQEDQVPPLPLQRYLREPLQLQRLLRIRRARHAIIRFVGAEAMSLLALASRSLVEDFIMSLCPRRGSAALRRHLHHTSEEMAIPAVAPPCGPQGPSHLGARRSCVPAVNAAGSGLSFRSLQQQQQ